MKQLLIDLVQTNNPSRTIVSNCMALVSREVVGLDKYGVTLPDAGLTHEQLLQHGREEALDLANYLEAAIATARRSHLDHSELLGMVSRLLQDLKGHDEETQRFRADLKLMLLHHETARTLRALRRT